MGIVELIGHAFVTDVAVFVVIGQPDARILEFLWRFHGMCVVIAQDSLAMRVV